MNRDRGFTLIELLVYVAIFAIVAGLLTSIFFVIINSQKKASVSGEVSQQLNFVLTTVQRLVGDASLVEAVYEGQSPSSTCATFCTLKLRRGDPTKDPTLIFSNATGIYLQEGSTTQVTLTTNKILVNNLKFTKHEISGGHAVVEITTSFSYNTNNPTFAVTKAIESAIARVNAATFDADLLPNQDNTFDIGQIGSNLRWKSGRFSGDVTIGGNVGIGTTSPADKLEVASGTIRAASGLSYGISIGPPGGTYGNKIVTNGNDLFLGINPAKSFFILERNGTGVVTFTESGNVGIGTTSPANKLTISDGGSPYSGGTNRLLQLFHNGANQPVEMLLGNSTNGFVLRYGNGADRFDIVDGGNVERISVFNGGNVGIGTTNPGTYRLAIVQPPVTGNYGLQVIAGNTASDIVAQFTGNSSVLSQGMTIIQNGNVGIGTTGPTYQLQLSTNSAGKPDGGSWANSSDERLKTDITPISSGLEQLIKLKPVSFSWRNPDLHGGVRRSGGFLAQNVMQEFPGWVTQIDATGADRVLVGTDGKAYSLTLPFEYDAVVVQAIKELNQKIDAFTQGVARVVNLVVDRLTVGSSGKPTGITIFDKETHDPYCLEIINGVVKSSKGECQ